MFSSIDRPYSIDKFFKCAVNMLINICAKLSFFPVEEQLFTCMRIKRMVLCTRYVLTASLL